MRPDQKKACLAIAAKAKKGELTAKEVPLAGTIIEQLVDSVERAEVATLDVFAGDAVTGLVPFRFSGELRDDQLAAIAFDIGDACMAERARRQAAAEPETKDPEKNEVSDD